MELVRVIGVGGCCFLISYAVAVVAGVVIVVAVDVALLL